MPEERAERAPEPPPELGAESDPGPESELAPEPKPEVASEALLGSGQEPQPELVEAEGEEQLERQFEPGPLVQDEPVPEPDIKLEARAVPEQQPEAVTGTDAPATAILVEDEETEVEAELIESFPQSEEESAVSQAGEAVAAEEAAGAVLPGPAGVTALEPEPALAPASETEPEPESEVAAAPVPLEEPSEEQAEAGAAEPAPAPEAEPEPAVESESASEPAAESAYEPEPEPEPEPMAAAEEPGSAPEPGHVPETAAVARHEAELMADAEIETPTVEAEPEVEVTPEPTGKQTKERAADPAPAPKVDPEPAAVFEPVPESEPEREPMAAAEESGGRVEPDLAGEVEVNYGSEAEPVPETVSESATEIELEPEIEAEPEAPIVPEPVPDRDNGKGPEAGSAAAVEEQRVVIEVEAEPEASVEPETPSGEAAPVPVKVEADAEPEAAEPGRQDINPEAEPKPGQNPEPGPEANPEPEAEPAIDEKAAARQRSIQKKIAEADPDSPFSILVGQVYDGPLDLLLDLIRKQDIDIYDIPIARITSQFLAYVDRLRATDVDVAGDFIYTASLLIHIKSKMLLPRMPAEAGEQPEDPRRELVERLLEHERFRNAAQMLQEKQMLEAASWTNPGAREFKHDQGTEPEIAADTVDLVRVFREVLERARKRPVIDVNEESVTVGQMIQFLTRRLTMEDKPVALRRLLSHTRSERALIAMFLALLELVRMQAILLRQDRAFSEILIKRHEGFDALVESGVLQARDDWR